MKIKKGETISCYAYMTNSGDLGLESISEQEEGLIEVYLDRCIGSWRLQYWRLQYPEAREQFKQTLLKQGKIVKISIKEA